MGLFTRKKVRAPIAPKPPTVTPDLSFDDLANLKQAVDGEITRRAASEMDGIRAKLRATSQTLGVSIPELLGLPGIPPTSPRKERKKREARPKYQNPNDSTQQWSGRGKPPRWLQDLIEAGANKDNYLIDKPNGAASGQH